MPGQKGERMINQPEMIEHMTHCFDFLNAAELDELARRVRAAKVRLAQTRSRTEEQLSQARRRAAARTEGVDLIA